MKIAKLASIILSLMVAFQPLLALSQSLPDFGNTSRKVLSKHEEKKLGSKIMQNIQSQVALIDDPFVKDYIQTLGNLLAVHSTMNADVFTFFTVKANSINAFALPGGNIGIHSGLILTTRTQSELAGVLAHEIAHVTQHHIARMFERASKMSIPTIAAILGSIALATQNPEAGSGALAATMAASQQAMINFTRSNEEEADRVGLELLHKAKFDPNGMPNFFERMHKANHFNQFDFPEFLRTHPVTQSRIADTRNRVTRLSKNKPINQLHYQLIRARVESLTNNNFQELSLKYNEKIKEYQFSDNQVMQYGLALAQFNLGQYIQSETIMKNLLKKNKYELLYHSLLADSLSQQNKTKDALKILENLLNVFPANHPLTVQYANLLYRNGDNKQAYQVLNEHVKIYTHDINSYQLLSEIAASNKYIWQAHDANARYFEMIGDYTNAIRQLKAAKELNNKDEYVKAMLDARIKQLEEDEKESE